MNSSVPRGRLGKHAILGAIGRGGMADVYLAVAHGPPGVRKLVVVKCVRAGNEVDATLARMFLDEGRLAALLNHPNVVHTYEVAHGPDGSYIVMEYLHGQALSAIARAAKPLEPRLAARIAADALAGLHYAHELRDLDGTALAIVHRDLSPPNIFVTYDGVVKLVDFGIAKTAIATRASTEAGLVKGKLAYMAPEQATSGVVDRRADIYAMGVVLWELLTGRRLVEDLSPASIFRRTLQETSPLVSSIRAEIEPALDLIVAKALSKDPDARYATALEMREALEEVLAEGPVTGSKELGLLMAAHFSVQRAQREREIQAWAELSPEEPATVETVTRSVALDEQSPAWLSAAFPSAARFARLRSNKRLARGLLLGGVLLPSVTAFAWYSGTTRGTERSASAISSSAPSLAAAADLRSMPGAAPSVPAAHASRADPFAVSSPMSASSPARRAPLVPAPRPRATSTAASAPLAALPSRTVSPPPAPALERNPYLHAR